MLSHRPFGTEHPYPYDLDQRVPPRPLPGEPYEIRVLSDEHVVVVFDDGTAVEAVPTDPATVELDHGARPAPAAGSAGHLSVASGLGPETGVHVLGWWRSIQRLRGLLTLGATVDDLGAWVALDVHGAELGPLVPGMMVSWAPRPGRGMFFDRAQHASPEVIIVPSVEAL